MINILLKSILKKNNMSVDHTETKRNLIKLMYINEQGVVVILKNGRPAGIMTERDIAKMLYNNVDLDEGLDSLLSKKLISTRDTRSVVHGLNLMTEHNIRRLIVTDDNNNFLGVVTQQNMLQYIENDYYRAALKVKHILDRLNNIICVSPDETLRNALAILVEKTISAVPIVSKGRAIGIITEKDILNFAANDLSLESRVSEHMSSPVICTTSETPLVEIANQMNENNIKRVVVNDKRGLATNIVTIRDIFRNSEGDYSKFLKRKLENAKDVLNLLPEMLIEVTDTGSEQLIIWTNKKFSGKFGDEIIDKPITDVIPETYWNEILSAIVKLGSIEHFKFKKDTEIFELSGHMININEKAENGRFQLILRDITEEVMLSITDTLTGIYNRRFINEFLQKELERSKRTERNISVVICDINDLKKINDTYGHLAGDIVIKSFSDVLTNNLRKSDVVGRYGGDEFFIILPETPSETIQLVVERIQNDLSRLLIPVSESVKVHISASFGSATYPSDGSSSDELLIKSDSNLYLHKQKKHCPLTKDKYKTSLF